MSLNMVVSETTEQTDSRWRRVEVRQLMLRDSLPITGRSRVDGGRLENGGSDTVCKGAVHEITVDCIVRLSMKMRE